MSFLRLLWSVPVVLFGALLVLNLVNAQERPARKVALVVGVAKYDHDFADLKFTERDASELAKELRGGGFHEVVVLTGSGSGKDRATRKNIEKRLQELLDGNGDDSKKIKKGDVVLVALSGHGQQIFVPDPADAAKKKEDAFFCPVDGKPNKAETLLSISHLVDDLLAPCGSRNLLLVDACRDISDPNKGKGVEGRDMSLKGETAVLFSCGRGEKSWESDEVQHGVFTYAVLRALRGSGTGGGVVTWSSLTVSVEESLASEEFKKYIPEGYSQTPIPTRGQLPRTVLMATAKTMVPVPMKDLGSMVPVPMKDLGSTGDLLPGEKFETFEYVIEGERKKGNCRVLTLDIGGGEKMEFVRIQKGRFMMGSPGDEELRSDDEGQHEVQITKDFYLGKFTVMQSQYKAIVGTNPSKFTGDRLPVETVSWDDATKYCDLLSKTLNRKVTLPSEAQWEYACRAETKTPFHFGSKLNGDLANCDGNYPYGTAIKGTSKQRTVEVGSYPANPWGLYDMSGNVYQWCQDYYGPYSKLEGKRDPVQLLKQSNNYRVLRGGSWSSLGAWNCRSANRIWNKPVDRSFYNGFRVCLPLDK